MRKYDLPIINQQVDTVILANGAFPTHPIPLSILNNCKHLVCCDGSIDKIHRMGKQPNAIVGDCDSLSDENEVRYESIIHRITEQNTNDLTKAVNFCIRQNKKNIVILGATGKREDHTIGNISLLSEYIKKGNVKIITDYGVFVAIETTSVFESMPKQQVSIFCIDRQEISSRNLVFPIQQQKFYNWWEATLNEAITDEFTIETTGRTIIYRVF